MTGLPAQIIAWVNLLTNALGKSLLAPVSVLPGWLSNTIVSTGTGLLILVFFKYFSNQPAIHQARDDIKAHTLALKLFKDNFFIIFLAPLGVFRGVLRLLLHSLRPMLGAFIPIALLLAQLALWYQSRPLRSGEYATVTMKLACGSDSPWPAIAIKSTPAAETTTGPIRDLGRRRIWWEIKAGQNGPGRLIFQVDGREIEKELVVGDGFMRVSAKRPGWRWLDIMLHPAERPFGANSTVQSITIDYPDRPSFTSGTDWWVVYFFLASMVSALILKPFLKVRI